MYVMNNQDSEYDESFAQVQYTQLTGPVFAILINTGNHTLTLYKTGKVFKTFPVAVGKPSTPTPTGTFRIINKSVNPGGPFGVRWLGLSVPNGDYGIHGTNNSRSIGRSVSNGCIRMFNNDVTELFDLVSIGASVKIIQE